MIRKLLITCAVAAMVIGPVVAQEEEAGITFGAWGRGAFAPLIIVGDNTISDGTADGTEAEKDTGWVGAGNGATWGGGQQAEFEVKGTSQYIGFGIGMVWNATGGIGLNATGAHAWVRPLGNDMLKIYAGNFAEDALRGKVGNLNNGFGSFVAAGGFAEEDAIFTRFRTDKYGAGFMLSSRPIDPLFIGLKVDAPLPFHYTKADPITGDQVPDGDFNGRWDNPYNAADIYRTIQIGLGYEIEGVGHIRAQFIGGYVNVDTDPSNWDKPLTGADGLGNRPNMPISTDSNAKIEAAFAFTGMEGLLVDLGLRFNLPMTIVTANQDDQVYSNGFDINLGATFQQDSLRIKGRLGLNGLGASYDDGTVKTSYGPMFELNLVPAYAVGDNSWIGLDLGLRTGANTPNTDPGDEKADFDLGFGAFFEQNFSNGLWKVGAAYRLPTSYDGNNKINGNRGVFSVPVILEYWF